MAQKHFGTDGIRGLANAEITPELAMKVAQATGIIFHRGEHRHGGDRQGYAALRLYDRKCLGRGFTSVGIDVLLLGPMPTPAVAMLTHSMRRMSGS